MVVNPKSTEEDLNTNVYFYTKEILKNKETTFGYGTKAGIEFHKNHNRAQFYYGSDIRFRKYANNLKQNIQYKSYEFPFGLEYRDPLTGQLDEYDEFTTEYKKTINKTSIGITPFLGIRFKPSERFSISTELGVDFKRIIQEFEDTNLVIMDNDIRYQDLEAYSSQIRINSYSYDMRYGYEVKVNPVGVFSINYHF
ncbi:MAG: hypothetical protein ACRCVT_09010 [Leadbetterella sp.]